MATDGAYMSNVADGLVNLSITSGVGMTPATNGIFKEGNTANAHYGASITTLKRFDGNNMADIAFLNAGENKIEILLNGSTSTPMSITNISVGATSMEMKDALEVVSIGDINHDGRTDLLVATKYHDGTYANEGGAFVIFGNSIHL